MAETIFLVGVCSLGINFIVALALRAADVPEPPTYLWVWLAASLVLALAGAIRGASF